MLLLDEVWRKWPAGQNVRQVPVKEMALLKEHRHRVDAKGRAMRVVLVSQFPSDLASWTRKLVDTSYFMQKLDALGADKHFHVDVVKGCSTGENIPKRLIVQSRKGTYKPEIYQFYRSATTSETFTVGDETVADRRGVLWTSKWFWFCAVFGLTTVIGGPLYILFVFFPGLKESQQELAGPVEEPVPKVQPLKPVRLTNPSPEEVAAQSAEPLPSSVQPTHVPPPTDDQPQALPGDPPQSKFWRVAGFLERWDKDAQGFRDQVLLAGPGGQRRVLPREKCQAIEGAVNDGRGMYVYCDMNGERLTFWSGQENGNAFLGSFGIQPTGAAAAAERSEAPAAAPAVQPISTQTRVNVIPDTSRAPRTLMPENG
ncbi:hypothetical protein D9M68_615120 [compost metagenome]